MEFPHIGKHCSHSSCNKLDFLPVKCDACTNIFCHEHMKYADHNCPEGNSRDIQVPVCPLCNRPVPSKRSEPPDIAVGAHIDRDCQSDPAVGRRKVFINRCVVKGCKKKELVPFVCPNCRNNFCLSHRHPSDHSCQPKTRKHKNQSVSASETSSNEGYADIQGNMSEDEALARALALSLEEENNHSTRMRHNYVVNRQGSNHNSESNCRLS